MTHSPDEMTLASVSLVVLLPTLRLALKITIGGLLLKQLKKLKGARLYIPSSSIVETNAIGLGATMPSNNWWRSFVSISFGLKYIFNFLIVQNNRFQSVRAYFEVMEG